MEREKTLDLLKENLKDNNLVKHSLAVESAMRKLAKWPKLYIALIP